MTVVAQQSLMEPRNPLGNSGAPIQSQVRDENPRAADGLDGRVNASIVLHLCNKVP